MKELIGADVAYRNLVSPPPSDLLPADEFALYAVTARFPHNLSRQVPWQTVQDGVYDCRWGTDTIRVVVAGELPREPHNAPLHLFSAQTDLVDFGRSTYQRRSGNTSAVLGQLFGQLRAEGFAVSYTMEDFQRQYAKAHFAQLTPEERRDALGLLSPEERRQVLQSLPPEELLGVLSPVRIQEYLDQLTARRSTGARKQRRKK